jgi:hypothetical protein
MTTRGRPKHLFGLPPDRFDAWRLGRRWQEDIGPLLDQGNAVGTSLTELAARIEFTTTSFVPEAFWVRVQRCDGATFHLPMPVARGDIPDLLQLWGFERFQWAEGDEVERVAFIGTPPREFVWNPGPYWYLTTQEWMSGGYLTLRYDKAAATTSRTYLGLIIGDRIEHLGTIPCNRVRLGNILVRDNMDVITSLYRGATTFFRQRVIDGKWKPFTETALW